MPEVVSLVPALLSPGDAWFMFLSFLPLSFQSSPFAHPPLQMLSEVANKEICLQIL